MYLCVSRRYRYRLRDEVVNEQYLIEEIYERELDLAEQYDSDETDSDETNDDCSDESYLEREGLLESKQNYGSIQNWRLSICTKLDLINAQTFNIGLILTLIVSIKIFSKHLVEVSDEAANKRVYTLTKTFL